MLSLKLMFYPYINTDVSRKHVEINWSLALYERKKNVINKRKIKKYRNNGLATVMSSFPRCHCTLLIF